MKHAQIKFPLFSFWTVRLRSLAGRYGNPMPESTLSPQLRTMNMASVHRYDSSRDFSQYISCILEQFRYLYVEILPLEKTRKISFRHVCNKRFFCPRKTTKIALVCVCQLMEANPNSIL